MDCVLDSSEVIDLPLLSKGKVRELYAIPGHDNKLLFVASDRISAFDAIMIDGIPAKGENLTSMSLFWFNELKGTPNHLITADVNEYPEPCQPYKEYLAGRSMLVKKLNPLPVECIVRGRLSGSYLKEYNTAKTIPTESPGIPLGKLVNGFVLPMNLCENDEFLEPLFTPSTKAEQGLHDENISFEEMEEIIGSDLALEVKTASEQLFKQASAHAANCGIIIADTKFEFGVDPETGKLFLIDEVLTPDSSRFWPSDSVIIGQAPPSFDKQFLRDWLIGSGWDKEGVPPKVPESIRQQTKEKYDKALQLLTNN